jgi:S-disulfanyl-L-cysteine oxidoreductase SoxD
MRHHRWTFLLATCILGALPNDAVAQHSASSTTRSTQSGVYTAEQALRGRDVYAGMCQSCHTAASHAGPVFQSTWGGRPLSELFAFIIERMPKNDPGSLSREEYADVLAYLLKMNQMPDGSAELTPDSTALRTIRIDTKLPSSTHP